LTTDHLGSTRVVTNSTAGIKSRHDYMPFGEEIGPTVSTRSTIDGKYDVNEGLRQKFTSKERDPESGLDYFEARYYNSGHGRFTSPDEFAGAPVELFDFADTASGNPTFYANIDNPQSLNKYQYCYNNPLLYVDPNGHQERLFDPPAQKGGKVKVTPTGLSVLKVAAGTVVCPICGLAAILIDPPVVGAPTEDHKDVGNEKTATDALDEAMEVAVTGRLTSEKGANSEVEPNQNAKEGRSGKQEKLQEVANDPKASSADRGWVKQEQNQVERGKREKIRNPPGKDLAHERGREAAKGYSYKHSSLQNRKDHRTQHKYDNGGRSNKERPVK